jgi:dUTP pyrophosphatase
MPNDQILEMTRLDPAATLPTRAHEDDAGLDLYALKTIEVPPSEGRLVPTGVSLAVPRGCVGLIMDRSSMARKGFKTAGGVIDAGYRGEIGVVLWNISKEPLSVEKGNRIAQLLVVPILVPKIVEKSELTETVRGEKGFGSSGV